MAVRTSALLVGLDDVVRHLDEVADAASDLTPAWGPLGTLYARRMDTVFSTNGLGRWAPRAAATIDKGQSPLVDTGVMRDGLTRTQPRYDDELMAAYGPRKYDRRVMAPAILHTAGTKRMPKRVVVPPLRAAERRAWIGAVSDHLGKAVRS